MAQLGFYKYADDYETNLIRQDRSIAPAPWQTCEWLSPDRYNSAADAQQYLSLQYRPTQRIGPIPDDLLDFDYVPLRSVGQKSGQPGGGLEAATTQTIHLFSMTPLP